MLISEYFNLNSLLRKFREISILMTTMCDSKILNDDYHSMESHILYANRNGRDLGEKSHFIK